MGKRSKSSSTVNKPDLLVESKRVKNKKNEPSDANNEAKPEEIIIPSNDKQIKRKMKNKSQSSEVRNEKKNKKIIFNEDDNEPVEVDNSPIQQKRTNQGDSQENEENVKDEDIDKFCDELNEEDNEQYENWVKLIEAKLTSNKKKPK